MDVLFTPTTSRDRCASGRSVTFHWSPTAVGSSSRPSWTTVSSELTTEKTQPPELDCGLMVAIRAKSCRWSERISLNGDFRSASLVTPNAGNPSSPSTNFTPQQQQQQHHHHQRLTHSDSDRNYDKLSCRAEWHTGAH
uniref:Uncharacterized protein n=1 Tax=Anopheles farauti TaxID=69004 RepID=A0A182Q1N4_9DIPT